MKVCYMLREDPVCLFDGNKKIQPRIRLAGADIGAGTCFYHIGNKTQTYKSLVEWTLYMQWPRCWQHTAFSVCRRINLLTRLSFSSRNILYILTTKHRHLRKLEV